MASTRIFIGARRTPNRIVERRWRVGMNPVQSRLVHVFAVSAAIAVG